MAWFEGPATAAPEERGPLRAPPTTLFGARRPLAVGVSVKVANRPRDYAAVAVGAEGIELVGEQLLPVNRLLEAELRASRPMNVWLLTTLCRARGRATASRPGPSRSPARGAPPGRSSARPAPRSPAPHSGPARPRTADQPAPRRGPAQPRAADQHGPRAAAALWAGLFPGPAIPRGHVRSREGDAPRRQPEGGGQRGTTVLDFVKLSIGAGLAKAAYFAKLDGAPVDLSRPLTADARLEVVTTKSPEALEVARHDAAHVMASVVQQLYPGTQVTIGPSIDDGFYYDFARPTPFTPEDLERIEKATNEAIKADQPFLREEVTPEAAIALFEGLGEKYKVEIVKDIVAKGATTLTLYRHGGWTDFCLGPHGPSTGRIGVVKLTLAWPGPTGAATPRTPCCSASTARPSSTRRPSTPTSRSWRR